MTASQAREHLSSGVHHRYSKIVSHGPLCSSSMARPIPYIDMDDVQQSTSAEPVRVALLCCVYYLTSFQMTVEDAISKSTGGRLHFTPYTYIPPSSVPDINQPSSHDTSPVTDPLHATGCSQVDSSLYNSCICFDHANNVHNVDHQWSTQPTWPEQPDIATFNFPLGKDNDPLPDDENICGEVDVSDLNVDLNGEFIILSSFSHCQMFLAVAEFEDILSTPLGVSPTSPTSPTFLYPSFAVSFTSLFLCTSTHTLKLYLTDMLFRFPWLWFSEQQKKAVLNWATQLGARNVPSLYSLSQYRENIKKVVGDLVMAVTTGTGHKLYMQDIPFLVAKVQLSPHGCNHYLWSTRHTQDYANPITCFAMWDCPVDGDGGTLQVFHGLKIHNICSNLVVPNVCVNDHIFFVDELLWTDDDSYFIPEQFFYQLPDKARLSGIPNMTGSAKWCGDISLVYEPSVHDLWSLGHKVMWTNVCLLTSVAQNCTDYSFEIGRLFCLWW